MRDDSSEQHYGPATRGLSKSYGGARNYAVESNEQITVLSDGLWFHEKQHTVKLWRVIVLFFLVVSLLFVFLMALSMGFGSLFFFCLFLVPWIGSFFKSSSEWSRKGLVLLDSELRWRVGFHRLLLHHNEVLGIEMESNGLSVLYRRGADDKLSRLRIVDQLSIPLPLLNRHLQEWRQEKNATPKEQEDLRRNQAWANRIYHLHQIRKWLPGKVSRQIALGVHGITAQQELLLSLKAYPYRIAVGRFAVRWFRKLAPVTLISSALFGLLNHLLVMGMAHKLYEWQAWQIGVHLFGLMWVWLGLYRNKWEAPPPSPVDIMLSVLSLGTAFYVFLWSSALPIWG